MMRNLLALLLLLLALPSAAAQQEVRIGVLGLFHAKEMLLEPVGAEVILAAAQGDARSQTMVLNGEPGHRQISFRADGNHVLAGMHSASSWLVTARNGGPVAFQLIVPGKIRRTYRGRLTLQLRNGEVQAVVGMEMETAVASIVAAEMVESATMEALKAQAVATRSFLAAGPRHLDFDFCDTTHCQFLKSPPPSTSRVAAAVDATRGLILSYHDKPLAVLYSSRCGGQTRSLRDVGMEPGEGYPYYSVRCRWCRQHPMTWHTEIGGSSPPKAGDEGRRIAEARQWGWSAIPGSDFTATKKETGWSLQGHSLGHGVGMCQHGAVGMAASGVNFREILSHYYPNTSLISLP